MGVSFFEANNVAHVMLDGDTRALINKKGQVLLEIPNKDFTIVIKDYYFRADSNIRFRLFDSVGKPLSNFVYYLKPEAYLHTKNDLIREGCIVMKDSARNISWDFGLINKKGETLTPFNCKQIQPLNDTLLACVQKYYLRDVKQYPEKPSRRKKIRQGMSNDSCLLELNLYTTKGKLIKSVYRNVFPETGSGQGFTAFKDFFIEYIQYYNDSSRLIEAYHMRDYHGGLIASDLKLARHPGDDDIQRINEGYYKMKNEEGLYAVYDVKAKRFISDFVFHDVAFYAGKVGYARVNHQLCKLSYDSVLHIENCGMNYDPGFKFSRYIRDDTSFFYDKALLGKTEKYHTIVSSRGVPFFSSTSEFNRIPKETPLTLKFFKNYYLMSYGWFDYDHRFISYVKTSTAILETSYHKLFCDTHVDNSFYSRRTKLVVGKGDYRGLFTHETFFSVNGTEYYDR